jgi:hypothetical protein
MGANGVLLDVTHGGNRVLFVQSAGIEAFLPQVPLAAMEAVDVPRIPEVRPADGLCKRHLGPGHYDKVEVVAHQTVTQNVQPQTPGVLREEFQVDPAVVIDEENLLAVVSALRNVIRHAGNDDARSP